MSQSMNPLLDPQDIIFRVVKVEFFPPRSEASTRQLLGFYCPTAEHVFCNLVKNMSRVHHTALSDSLHEYQFFINGATRRELAFTCKLSPDQLRPKLRPGLRDVGLQDDGTLEPGNQLVLQSDEGRITLGHCPPQMRLFQWLKHPQNPYRATVWHIVYVRSADKEIEGLLRREAVGAYCDLLWPRSGGVLAMRHVRKPLEVFVTRHKSQDGNYVYRLCVGDRTFTIKLMQQNSALPDVGMLLFNDMHQVYVSSIPQDEEPDNCQHIARWPDPELVDGEDLPPTVYYGQGRVCYSKPVYPRYAFAKYPVFVVESVTSCSSELAERYAWVAGAYREDADPTSNGVGSAFEHMLRACNKAASDKPVYCDGSKRGALLFRSASSDLHVSFEGRRMLPWTVQFAGDHEVQVDGGVVTLRFKPFQWDLGFPNETPYLPVLFVQKERISPFLDVRWVSWQSAFKFMFLQCYCRHSFEAGNAEVTAGDEMDVVCRFERLLGPLAQDRYHTIFYFDLWMDEIKCKFIRGSPLLQCAEEGEL